MSRLFGEVPPEIDRLRHIREAVNPEQVYQVELPDGIPCSTTGAEMIDLADTIVALSDAVRARDELALYRALCRLALDTD